MRIQLMKKCNRLIKMAIENLDKIFLTLKNLFFVYYSIENPQLISGMKFIFNVDLTFYYLLSAKFFLKQKSIK